MTQRQHTNAVGKNGADRFVQHRVATNLKYVKNAISTKHDKVKCNKMRYACTSYINLWSLNSFKEEKEKEEKLRYKSTFYFPVSWNGKFVPSLHTFSEETIESILLAHQVTGRRNTALCL